MLDGHVVHRFQSMTYRETSPGMAQIVTRRRFMPLDARREANCFLDARDSILDFAF
jgi:hypothetical protein